jgi:hypothetical protein
LCCSNRSLSGQTYFSTASGAWNSGIWEDELGNPVSDPDGFNIDVVINPGHAVTLPGSGTREVNNLTISSGASLNLGGSFNFFLEVFGTDIEINGTVGNPIVSAEDDVGFEIMGPACTISGSGTAFLSRLRKADDAENNYSPDMDLNIQMDLVLKWSGTALYNTKGGTFDVRIAAGVELDVPNGNVSIDGLSGSGVAASNGRYTIDGELLVPNGDLYLRTDNTSTGVEYLISPAGRLLLGGAVLGNDPEGPAQARLTVQSGGELELTGAAPWQAIGNAGLTDIALQPGSIVEYRSAAPQVIESSIAYQNLVAAGGGTKSLNGNTTMNGSLNLIGNNLQLDGHELHVNGGVDGAGPGGYIATGGGGQLRQPTGSADVLFPVGNFFFNPVVLGQVSPAANIGLRVADEVLENGNSGPAVTSGAVSASWFFSGGAGSTATVTVGWNDLQEQPAFSDSDCFISYYDGSWQQGSPASGASNSLTRSGIPLSAPVAVGSGQVLPVALVRFTAIRQSGAVLLEWRTESEIHNDYFALERAGEALQFEEIGRVAGRGTTAVPQDYLFRDERPLAGISYYRLKQVDFDGTWTYSPMRSVAAAEERLPARLYPNPTRGPVDLFLGHPARPGQIIRLFDTAGQEIQRYRLEEGRQWLDLDLSGLPAGMYFLQGAGESLRIRKR